MFWGGAATEAVTIVARGSTEGSVSPRYKLAV